jgi:hypothetical protein
VPKSAHAGNHSLEVYLHTKYNNNNNNNNNNTARYDATSSLTHLRNCRCGDSMAHERSSCLKMAHYVTVDISVQRCDACIENEMSIIDIYRLWNVNIDLIYTEMSRNEVKASTKKVYAVQFFRFTNSYHGLFQEFNNWFTINMTTLTLRTDLNPRNSALLAMRTVAQLVKFPTLFVQVFTTASYQPLSYATWLESTLLPTLSHQQHLGLPSLISFRCSNQNFVRIIHISHAYYILFQS